MRHLAKARGERGWGVRDLADKAYVSVRTVIRAEISAALVGMPGPSRLGLQTRRPSIGAFPGDPVFAITAPSLVRYFTSYVKTQDENAN